MLSETATARAVLLPRRARRLVLLGLSGACGVAIASTTRPSMTTFVGALIILAVVAGLSALWSP